MYENELELGLPHERQFTIACVVSKYREVGQGKSKKIAKRLAAHKMWINIHKNALAKSKANQDLDDDGNPEVRNLSDFLFLLQIRLPKCPVFSRRYKRFTRCSEYSANRGDFCVDFYSTYAKAWGGFSFT